MDYDPWSPEENALFARSYDDILASAVAAYAESEKVKNQTIGESRAVQELAFRDKILSEKGKKLENPEKFYWVTVNPRKDTALAVLVSLIKKMYSKKWIQKYAYVFETTKNNHQHSHGLIKANYEPSRARKELSNTVSKICDTTNVHCFKFVILTEEQAKEKVEYMLGKKQSKKLDDVELTIKWRQENSLQPIYEGPPNLVGPSEPS